VTSIEDDFHAYKERLTRHPDTFDFHVILPAREAPERIIQYHYKGKDTFGAVYDPQHNFRSFIPKVEFN